jgi:hypothetical protein
MRGCTAAAISFVRTMPASLFPLSGCNVSDTRRDKAGGFRPPPSRPSGLSSSSLSITGTRDGGREQLLGTCTHAQRAQPLRRGHHELGTKQRQPPWNMQQATRQALHPHVSRRTACVWAYGYGGVGGVRRNDMQMQTRRKRKTEPEPID